MSLDEYVLKLRQLSASYEFGYLTIQNRLVLGTNDSTCKYRVLRSRSVPTLADCILSLIFSTMARQHQEHAKDQAIAIDAVSKKTVSHKRYEAQF